MSWATFFCIRVFSFEAEWLPVMRLRARWLLGRGGGGVCMRALCSVPLGTFPLLKRCLVCFSFQILGFRAALGIPGHWDRLCGCSVFCLSVWCDWGAVISLIFPELRHVWCDQGRREGPVVWSSESSPPLQGLPFPAGLQHTVSRVSQCSEYPSLL